MLSGLDASSVRSEPGLPSPVARDAPLPDGNEQSLLARRVSSALSVRSLHGGGRGGAATASASHSFMSTPRKAVHASTASARKPSLAAAKGGPLSKGSINDSTARKKEKEKETADALVEERPFRFEVPQILTLQTGDGGEEATEWFATDALERYELYEAPSAVRLTLCADLEAPPQRPLYTRDDVEGGIIVDAGALAQSTESTGPRSSTRGAILLPADEAFCGYDGDTVAVMSTALAERVAARTVAQQEHATMTFFECEGGVASAAMLHPTDGAVAAYLRTLRRTLDDAHLTSVFRIVVEATWVGSEGDRRSIIGTRRGHRQGGSRVATPTAPHSSFPQAGDAPLSVVIETDRTATKVLHRVGNAVRRMHGLAPFARPDKRTLAVCVQTNQFQRRGPFEDTHEERSATDMAAFAADRDAAEQSSSFDDEASDGPSRQHLNRSHASQAQSQRAHVPAHVVLQVCVQPIGGGVAAQLLPRVGAATFALVGGLEQGAEPSLQHGASVLLQAITAVAASPKADRRQVLGALGRSNALAAALADALLAPLVMSVVCLPPTPLQQQPRPAAAGLSANTVRGVELGRRLAAIRFGAEGPLRQLKAPKGAASTASVADCARLAKVACFYRCHAYKHAHARRREAATTSAEMAEARRRIQELETDRLLLRAALEASRREAVSLRAAGALVPDDASGAKSMDDGAARVHAALLAAQHENVELHAAVGRHEEELAAVHDQYAAFIEALEGQIAELADRGGLSSPHSPQREEPPLTPVEAHSGAALAEVLCDWLEANGVLPTGLVPALSVALPATVQGGATRAAPHDAARHLRLPAMILHLIHRAAEADQRRAGCGLNEAPLSATDRAAARDGWRSLLRGGAMVLQKAAAAHCPEYASLRPPLWVCLLSGAGGPGPNLFELATRGTRRQFAAHWGGAAARVGPFASPPARPASGVTLLDATTPLGSTQVTSNVHSPTSAVPAAAEAVAPQHMEDGDHQALPEPPTPWVVEGDVPMVASEEVPDDTTTTPHIREKRAKHEKKSKKEKKEKKDKHRRASHPLSNEEGEEGADEERAGAGAGEGNAPAQPSDHRFMRPPLAGEVLCEPGDYDDDDREAAAVGDAEYEPTE